VNADGKLALYTMGASDIAQDVDSTAINLWTITFKAIAPTEYRAPAYAGAILRVATSADFDNGGEFSYGVYGTEGQDATPVAGGIFTADLNVSGIKTVAPAKITITSPTDSDTKTYQSGTPTINFGAEVGWADSAISGVAPEPSTVKSWAVTDITSAPGSNGTPTIDASSGALTVPSGFRGTAVVKVTANYNNNFGTNRDTVLDNPYDEILLTFTDTGVVVGDYAKVSITSPTTGTTFTAGTTSIPFVAALSWDDALNGGTRSGEPTPGTVKWTIADVNKTSGTAPTIDQTTGVLTNNGSFIGTLKVVATADRANPDGAKPSDEVTVYFTADGITIGDGLKITGKVQLAKKMRNGIQLFSYVPRADLDKGITVSLVGVKTGGGATDTIATSVTGNDGSFSLGVPSTVELYGGSDYVSFKLVISRGNSGGLRSEAYLSNEVVLTASSAITGEVDLVAQNGGNPIWLFPGDYDGNGTIASADYSEIKAKVGLVSASSGYDQKYDINEYTGIDGGDLASVKSSVGKTVANNGHNTAVGGKNTIALN
jgi:hypothetical protein